MFRQLISMLPKEEVFMGAVAVTQPNWQTRPQPQRTNSKRAWKQRGKRARK